MAFRDEGYEEYRKRRSLQSRELRICIFIVKRKRLGVEEMNLPPGSSSPVLGSEIKDRLRNQIAFGGFAASKDYDNRK